MAAAGAAGGTAIAAGRAVGRLQIIIGQQADQAAGIGQLFPAGQVNVLVVAVPLQPLGVADLINFIELADLQRGQQGDVAPDLEPDFMGAGLARGRLDNVKGDQPFLVQHLQQTGLPVEAADSFVGGLMPLGRLVATTAGG